MSFWDKVLRLFGTNRVRLGWRWRTFKEGWGKKGAARATREAAGSFIPDDFPLVTMTLMGLCVLFYFLTIQYTSDLVGESVLGPNEVALVKYGATWTPLVLEGGQWWRYVTSFFLHGSVTHLLFNMIALWSVGTVAEERFGRARMLAVYVAAGGVGMVASVWWHKEGVLGTGASGAVFGLMACIVAHAMRQGTSVTARELKSRFVPWLIFALVMGLLVPHTDNAAHVGGLLTGGLCGVFLGERTIVRRVPVVWELAAASAVGVVAYAFYAVAQFNAVTG